MENILFLYNRMYNNSAGVKEGFFGGAQKSCFQIAEFFNKKYQNAYLASDDQSEDIERLGNINHIRVPFRAGAFFNLYSFYKLFKIIRYYDIKLIHSNDRYSAFFAFVVCKITNTKFVYTERNIRENKYYTKLFYGKNIVAISKSVKNNLINVFKVSGDKIDVIQNGSEVKSVNVDVLNAIKKKNDINDSHSVATVIARLSKQKGHIYLLKAVKEILSEYPNLRIFFVGDGNLSEMLKKEVEKYNLDNNIIFCGQQTNVAEYIALSQFTILPSLWEGFGLSAIESFSLGKPVIASDTGGLSEIIDHGINGWLVEPKNERELHHALKYFIEKKNEINNMGENALKKYRKYYTPEVMAGNYEEYFKKVLEK